MQNTTPPAGAELDHQALSEFVSRVWDESIVEELIEYIKIPNQSPAFDPNWEANGHMARAVELIEAWCRAQEIEGLTVEVIQLEGRTPVIYMEVPAISSAADPADSVLLYGHLDKQPEMTGWREDLGPWKPKLEAGRLYGRGGADDGYAAFASLTAIRALQMFGGKHVRCSILIEGCEESGSYDLPHYIERLAERIGSPSLVICLDSGCGNYDQLWSTTSLRGLVTGTLRVEILKEGVHSGDASGVVPSSFRILRSLLDRIEDPISGEILGAPFHGEISGARREQASLAADVLGDIVSEKFPFAGGAHAISDDRAELVLNRTWRPALSVTGVEGIPSLESAGNVLRPYTAVKLSLRLPPTVDAAAASAHLKATLEADPPYAAKVSFEPDEPAPGWEAPALAPWLEQAVDSASQAYFGAAAVYMGEGGSIPFMGMLGERFPDAQFLITGVLGPGSNAHGPNEFLDIPTGKRVTCCVAQVLARHAAR
ncbi:MAG: M20 family metallopeptidase [Deltaproteobacteria bacterium]|nr:M20 family metallopeptidase [Deltaproteobacteria bacterium]MBW2389882.1 M20 family metallopeptidase [Deltaproteobacteria bacterium]MBW2723905.1 M20 family metallopeptidase [Deltaproteobacteria bacterium]